MDPVGSDDRDARFEILMANMQAQMENTFAAIQEELREIRAEVRASKEIMKMELQEILEKVEQRPKVVNPDEVDSNGLLKIGDSGTKNLLQSMVQMQTEMFGFFSKNKANKSKSRLSLGERGKALDEMFAGAEDQYEDSDDGDVGGADTGESESEEDVILPRGVRRGSLIKEANGFVKSREVNQIIVTRAPGSTDHIVLPYLSVKTVLQFMRAINRYQAREGISLKAAGIIEEGVVQNILAKNYWIRGDREFYNLSNDKLFVALQRAIRPVDMQGFLVALEQNVTFGKPGDEPPSWNKFKKLAECMDVYRLEFVEAFNLLIQGCDFKKELKYNGKDGSVDRIFTKGIPGVYARNLLRGGRHEFDGLKDFLDYFFEIFEIHRKLAKKSYQTARTYFTDGKKFESDQERPDGKLPFRTLNNIGASVRVKEPGGSDDDPDFAELITSKTGAPVEAEVHTDYFTGTSEDYGIIPSADDGEDPPNRHRKEINAAIPNRSSGKFELLRKPGGSPTIQVCFSFATKGECKFARDGKTCTYSHDPGKVAKFLEEMLKQATSRLKDLRK